MVLGEPTGNSVFLGGDPGDPYYWKNCIQKTKTIFCR